MPTALVVVLNQLIGVAEEMKQQNAAHPSLGLTTQLSDLCSIITDVSYKITEELRKPSASTLCADYGITRGEKENFLASQISGDRYVQGKIPLIKAIRERTGLGLKEAKDIAEKWISDKVYFSNVSNRFVEHD